MNTQLSFGIEREILVDELQFYFEQNLAAEFEVEEAASADPRKKANDFRKPYFTILGISMQEDFISIIIW